MMNTSKLIENLRTDGYALLPDLITPEECDAYKQLLEKDYEAYAELYEGASSKEGDLANKSGEKVVFNLHNKHLSWYKLFEHPEILLLLDDLLKEGSYKNDEPYYLNNISARSPMKGHPGQQLHLDSRLPGVNYCITANVIWMLDDFTMDNGATRIVPQSHLWKFYAEDGLVHEDEVRITGKKGSALVFNASLWHGGAENYTNETRWAVALGYSRWFIKPSFDFMQNTPESVYEKLTDKQKELLGFLLVSPKDEFTRLRRKANVFEKPLPYKLPKQ